MHCCIFLFGQIDVIGLLHVWKFAFILGYHLSALSLEVYEAKKWLEMVNNAVHMTKPLKHVQMSWMITVQLVHKPRFFALTIPQA